MKHKVDCPSCGSQYLMIHESEMSGFNYAPWIECYTCKKGWTEAQVLKHMMEKPGMDPDAPAFRQLKPKVKAKGVSEAARKVFGG